MEALERIVFLDTETTGLDARFGHRIIEIAAVEALGRELTGRTIHFYLDPEREIDAGATAVHGFTWDDLRGKPKFSAVLTTVLHFLVDARVVIHNAPFDVSFIDQELARLREPPIAKRPLLIVDSLAMAKEKFPGKRNSLDALCSRLGVNNSHRNLHGALLDARLLAEVYFAMTRDQGVLQMSPVEGTPSAAIDRPTIAEPIPPILHVVLEDESRANHFAVVTELATQSGITRCWD